MTDAEKINEINCENTKLKMVSAIAKILCKDYGDEPPCNFNDNDCYMIDLCADYCDKHCENPDHIKCWEQWLKAKLKQEQISVCDKEIIIEEDLH